MGVTLFLLSYVFKANIYRTFFQIFVNNILVQYNLKNEFYLKLYMFSATLNKYSLLLHLFCMIEILMTQHNNSLFFQ